MSLEQLTLSDEQVQDIVASLITSGDNADAVYDDANDTLTVSLSDSISVNTLEATGSINTADISTAAQDEVLKKTSSGTDLKFGTVQTEPNVPDWTLDTDAFVNLANGFQTVSGIGGFDVYEVHLYIQNRSSGFAALQNINQDTPGFDVHNLDGSTTQAASSVEIANSSELTNMYVVMMIQADNNIAGYSIILNGNGDPQGTQSGVQSGVASSLTTSTGIDSLTFSDNGDGDARVQVFGRDIP